VGELFVSVMEEEGSFYCWNCLKEINNTLKRTRAHKKREENMFRLAEYRKQNLLRV